MVRRHERCMHFACIKHNFCGCNHISWFYYCVENELEFSKNWKKILYKHEILATMTTIIIMNEFCNLFSIHQVQFRSFVMFSSFDSVFDFTYRCVLCADENDCDYSICSKNFTCHSKNRIFKQYLEIGIILEFLCHLNW